MSYPHQFELGAKYFVALQPTIPGSVAFAVATSTLDLVPGDPYRNRQRNTRIVDLGTCNVHRIPVILNRWDLRCAVAPDDLAATLAGQGIRRLRRGMVASQLATLKQQDGRRVSASAEALTVSASQAEAGWTLPPEAETSLELRAVVMLAAAEAHNHRPSLVYASEYPFETEARESKRFPGF